MMDTSFKRAVPLYTFTLSVQ